MLRSLAVALMLVLALGACGDDDGGTNPDPGDQADELIGNTFVSTSVEGHEMVPDTAIQLVFTAESLAASAGCNSMSAEWTDDSEVIKWSGPVAATQMACSDELMAQDQWLTEVLTGGLSIIPGDADLNLEGDDLTIELAKQ